MSLIGAAIMEAGAIIALYANRPAGLIVCACGMLLAGTPAALAVARAR